MFTNKYKVQVDRSIYKAKNYMSEGRWLSFREQVISITGLKGVKTIAEIGKGSNIVSSILKALDYDVTTIDFDEALKPDIVCSILELRENINNKFDLILCAEVLEHLKFEDFRLALSNLSFITREYVILTLPYAGYTAKIVFFLSKYGERKVEFIKRLPLFWQTHKFDEHHYWEVGKRDFKERKIQQIIKSVFMIKRRWFLPYNKSQIFYLLKPK